MRFSLLCALLSVTVTISAAQSSASIDSDHDGLSDETESALLAQFAPHFLISPHDCSHLPAEFTHSSPTPIVKSDNGTIYGQAFPSLQNPTQVELHYYHLWRVDCGEMSHPLDAEHVAVLVAPDAATQWKALYWYAAAHEDTVCDASQITRASAVDGEVHGPQVWISRGKHASFLAHAICTHGCGGDDCSTPTPLPPHAILNLGELSAPMNDAAWVGALVWPLATKMTRSDFPNARVARIDQLPATTIAWANPEKRPMQAVILSGNSAIGGAATGLRATDTALDLADVKTGTALDRASIHTGNGLARAARGVKNALGATARKTGKALGAQ